MKFRKMFKCYPNVKTLFLAIILPMVESVASNFVNYLNAPNMQPPTPQRPTQAGYFELIKRAFHKLTVSNKIFFFLN